MANYVFENLCKKTVDDLYDFLPVELRKTHKKVKVTRDYIYAKGTYPVMLVAHMDTVHKESVKKIVRKNKGTLITSPQGIGGDDRCGIYMILEIVKEFNCSVLFTDAEEVGCIGAQAFAKAVESGKVKPAPVNYIVEFDRRNGKDAVYYELDNEDFEEWVAESSGKYFKTAWGTYTDICEIAPVMKVAAVNLSCGYYKEHTKDEYVNLREMEASIEAAKKIIGTKVDKTFEWKEVPRTYKWSRYDDWGYGYGYGGKYEYLMEYEILFMRNGMLCVDYQEASSDMEALGFWCQSFPDLNYNAIIAINDEDSATYDVTEEYYINGEYWDYNKEYGSKKGAIAYVD